MSVVCLHLLWGGEGDGKESEDDDERGGSRKDKRKEKRNREREKKGKEKDVTRRVLNHYQSTKENLGLEKWAKVGKAQGKHRPLSPSKKAMASTLFPPSVGRDTSALLQAP